jgi:hypothetical protein
MEPREDIWVNGNPVRIAAGQFAAHGEPRTLVRFAGPILPRWRAALKRARVVVEFWCPPLGACLRLPRSLSPPALEGRFPFLAGATAYRQEHCQRFDAAHGAAIGRSPLPGRLADVVCFSRSQRLRVEEQLSRLRIPVLLRARSKLRIDYPGDLAAIRDLPGVKLADRARLPRLLSFPEIASAIGLPAATAGAIAASPIAGLTGDGEVIAVADTGLDRGVADASLHPDFRGRVKQLVSLPMNDSWRTFATARTDDAADRGTGHGTHVAGLALGSGSASRGLHRGIAPGAQLVFQALEQDVDVHPEYRAQLPPGYYLAGRPLDLRDLFAAARQQGARIHVNSWGDPARGAYTDDCYEADLFLQENPDAVVLFAAGNDGADRDANRTIDPGSLYAPATAKNVIAVGATEGPLAGAGSRSTWGGLDPNLLRWRSGADRQDPVSGEPRRIAPFSSAGPTRDGRIKPDLAAPGTNLPGPRSQASRFTGWGLADPLPLYMYDGGTSMATAIAGGAMALIRQAWRLARGGRSPSGAALKALAILGAVPVASRAPGREATPFEAGFGLLQVERSLPGRRRPTPEGLRTVSLLDVARGGLDTGQCRDRRLSVRAGTRLEVVLCWYDAPGERLLNDLDLRVVGPGGHELLGNATPSAVPGPRADDRNTVERIRCGPLPGGRVTLRVTGANVPQGPQPFALAWALTEET